MNLIDVYALVISDFKGNSLIKKVFNIENEKLEEIMKKCSTDRDPIFIFEDYLVFCKKEQDLICILVSNINNNEIFLGQAFEEFILALKQVLSKFTKEKIHKKYDVIFLLVDIFVYEGIIAENKSEKMLELLPKRSFESTEGMKVPKGLASVINNASKNFSRYI
ncbi:coatomer subunit zeta [Vairimorpha necatrix]|uniref:Coatomer subunit zeta n=1 Tax=Vairimorpha necatrix TaxID=6039 RepID=A0AAX4JDY1_9MICR